MTKLLRGLIFWPLLVLAILLAIANRRSVLVSLDPFSLDEPAFAFTVPLFLVLMAGVGVGVLLGGLSAWADQAHWRRAARQYLKRINTLEAQAGLLPTTASQGGTQLSVPQSRRA